MLTFVAVGSQRSLYCGVDESLLWEHIFFPIGHNVSSTRCTDVTTFGSTFAKNFLPWCGD